VKGEGRCSGREVDGAATATTDDNVPLIVAIVSALLLVVGVSCGCKADRDGSRGMSESEIE